MAMGEITRITKLLRERGYSDHTIRVILKWYSWLEDRKVTLPKKEKGNEELDNV